MNTDPFDFAQDRFTLYLIGVRGVVRQAHHRSFWESAKKLLKEKGRVVNQKNHDKSIRQAHFDKLSANRTGTQGTNWWGFSILIGGCP